jgi:hypothetical protein
MIDLITQAFPTYYGLDWASMMLGFVGLYLITEKRRIGFVFAFFGFVAAVATALIAHQYGFIAANLISLGLMIRGYLKWAP